MIPLSRGAQPHLWLSPNRKRRRGAVLGPPGVSGAGNFLPGEERPGPGGDDRREVTESLLSSTGKPR